MPYIGLIPFLQVLDQDTSPTKKCFNALHRAHPISTDILWDSNTYDLRFQCPTSGSSHFYYFKEVLSMTEKIVSMPYIGLIPFLH